MALVLQDLPIDVALTRDDTGHRTWDVKWRAVKDGGDTNYYGPSDVLGLAGLPAIGSYLNIGGEIDLWSFCLPGTKIQRERASDPADRTSWILTQKFSTIPLTRCQDTTIENPLLEPPRISGGFDRTTGPATEDKDGNPIMNTAKERFKGAEVNRSFSNHTFAIEITSLTLDLDLIAEYMDAVNDDTLYGLTERKIKVASASWQQLLYGTCTYYYTIAYELATNKDTWDLKVANVGTKQRFKAGDTPDCFKPIVDGLTERGVAYLDANGYVTDPASSTPLTFEVYEPKNLLLLGLPATLT